MSGTQGHVIVVAGAGPAGMAVASALSKAGHEIIILNRDIKFGGLAEYGIFPSKLKLRGGLKKQYWELLQQKNIHYFGNVSIGNGRDLSVEDVRGLGASAVVFGRVDELPPGRISQHSTSHSYAQAWHVDPIADLQPG